MSDVTDFTMTFEESDSEYSMQFTQNDVEKEVELGTVIKGDDGVTFTPSVSEEGIISWTNDGGRENPESRNIKGPAGTTSWDGITDKPDTFPPSEHNHDGRYYTESEVDDLLEDKVDKVEGKGLSTNDYSNAEKQKVAKAEAFIITASNVTETTFTVDKTWTEVTSAMESGRPVILKVTTLDSNNYSLQLNNYKSSYEALNFEITVGMRNIVFQLSNVYGTTAYEGFITSSIWEDYEDTDHKVTVISSESTDEQYPSAKAVYDVVGNIESLLEALR